jgi:hypothetical protein
VRTMASNNGARPTLCDDAGGAGEGTPLHSPHHPGLHHLRPRSSLALLIPVGAGAALFRCLERYARPNPRIVRALSRIRPLLERGRAMNAFDNTQTPAWVYDDGGRAAAGFQADAHGRADAW